MFESPEHSRNLSLRLSQVLDEIGVNEDLVMRRRRAWLLVEKINTFGTSALDGDISIYNFGSQTEGSTTIGLTSDFDCLYRNGNLKVIADWSEWEPISRQYLMVQDDKVSPGYCLLQAVRSDAPLPMQDIENKHHSSDHSCRVLLKHSWCFDGFGLLTKEFPRNGPAIGAHEQPGVMDFDHVNALFCSTWPKEVNDRLLKQNASGWPTEDMKRYLAKPGCFIVPVNSKAGVYQDLEWRISTCHEERYLMWSLNITQMRCYILMKMIIKTFLKPKCGETISSFMCKNILFQTIADSSASCEWTEDSLVTWLNQCLQALLDCILTENCPHFIIPKNNLLAGKLSREVKDQMTEVMCKLTENIEQSLLAIQIDALGNRLAVKSGIIRVSEVQLMSKYDIVSCVAIQNTFEVAHILLCNMLVFKLAYEKLDHLDEIYKFINATILVLCLNNSVGDTLEQAAISLYSPFICNYAGSIKASIDIGNSQMISDEALRWFSLGLISDICSGRLKLASALYCAGDLGRCETILAALKLKLSQTQVLSVCSCRKLKKIHPKEFGKLCYEKNEDAIKQNMAICVAYSPSEVNCILFELKYEMFRSSEEDRPYRRLAHFWMDWAVVDSLPYLHFLQYKVYRELNRPKDQQLALYNLLLTIVTEPNLGHKETALNLLGQCMEQENSNELALSYYIWSLRVRARNNVAKWHVCRLLFRIFNQKLLKNKKINTHPMS